jgi:hypothetical protein
MSPVAWSQALMESGAQDRSALHLTIYNDDRALVQETRSLKLPVGQSSVLFSDVSAQVEPTSLIVGSSGDMRILEQNYEYDLITAEKLLDKYVGRKLTLLQDQGPQLPAKAIEAKLLANNGTPIFEIDGKIQLGLPPRVILPTLPENLAARPSLKWLVQSPKGGNQNVQVSYLSRGLNWSADYVLLVDSKDQEAELNGWISLNNRSGTAFKDAKLKLVAGEVNQVRPEAGPPAWGRGKMAMAAMPMADEMVQEKAFDEYHLYTVPRPVTVADQQTKQVQLLSAPSVKVQKIYRASPGYVSLNGNSGDGFNKLPVQVELQFKTSKDNGLELPMPAGIVRVYKRDDDGSQIFVGEDRIGHTPKNEKVSIKTGEAFDLVVEQRQVSYERQGKNAHLSSWEVKIRNRKSEAVTVYYDHPVWGDVSQTQGPKAEKLNANTLRYAVQIAPDAEQVLQFSLRIKE